MRNGERWCFEMARLCLAQPIYWQLAVRVICHRCHIELCPQSCVTLSCPLPSAHVTCVIIQLPSWLPLNPGGFVLVLVSYSISFVSVLSVFALHVCHSFLSQRSCNFLSVLLSNVSVSALSHVYLSKAGLRQKYKVSCNSSLHTPACWSHESWQSLHAWRVCEVHHHH